MGCMYSKALSELTNKVNILQDVVKQVNMLQDSVRVQGRQINEMMEKPYQQISYPQL